MRNSISPFYAVYRLSVYNLSFNSNCRILAAELNCTFTLKFSKNLNSNINFLNLEYIYCRTPAKFVLSHIRFTENFEA